MADRGGTKVEAGADAAGGVPLPMNLPPAMFSGPGLLALADLLPVMTAYVDRDEIFRFANRPYAEWMAQPRKELLGKSMRDLLGDDNYAARKPLIDTAMAGERQFFAATFEHPDR